MNYPQHVRLTKPAKPTAELWRLATGVALIVLIYLSLGALLMAGLALLMHEPAYSALTREMNGGTTPRGLIAQLLGVGLLAVPVLLVVRILHRRPATSVIGPWPETRRAFFRVAVGCSIALAAIWILPPSEYPVDGIQAKPLVDWARLLPLALPAILFQVTGEELVFRGYLQCQLAARFNSRLIWMGVPSAIFALLHYTPDAGANNVAVIAWAFVFGLIAADLTARTGTLGAAIALHFVNNIVALLVVALAGHSDALALFVLPVSLSDTRLLPPMVLVDLAVMLCLWLAARLALRT